MKNIFKNKKIIVFVFMIFIIIISGLVLANTQKKDSKIENNGVLNTSDEIIFQDNSISQNQNITKSENENINTVNPNEIVENVEKNQDEIPQESSSNVDNSESHKEEAKVTTQPVNQNNNSKQIQQSANGKKQEKPKKKETSTPVQQEKPIVQEKNKPVEKTKEKPKEQIKEQTKVQTPICSNGQHLIGNSNTGKWFDTKQEAVNYYHTTYTYWSNKWKNDEIDDDTFHKKCPNRYEVYQCACGKWAVDFFYEY